MERRVVLSVDLVKEIAARGHEIGCHGFTHADIDCSVRRVCDELERARSVLSSLVSSPIPGYRAPHLLVRDWMIPILRELGFHYDVSVCPGKSILWRGP